MTMSDRELLEFAAKACGKEGMSFVECVRDYDSNHLGIAALQGSCSADTWNPLEDDGEALRLAMSLGMSIYNFGSWFSISTSDRPKFVEESCPIGSDLMWCVRRAIVRAAAEICKTMQEKTK